MTASPAPDPRLSINQATIKHADLATALRVTADAGVQAIGLWREPVQEVGLATAARMLADSGLRFTTHCRGGFFTLPEGPERVAALDDNRRAIEEAATLAAAGADAPAPERGDWSAASGHAAGMRLAADPRVTAVFAANDQMALGLIRALSDAGRAVGDDVHVVGYDDVADAAEFRPPLTTVRQDFDALGEAAVTALVAAIDGTPATHTVVPTSLVLRASA